LAPPAHDEFTRIRKHPLSERFGVHRDLQHQRLTPVRRLHANRPAPQRLRY
jgi:hypothetical protein